MENNKLKGLTHACTAIALLQVVQQEIDEMEKHRFIFQQRVKQTAKPFQQELEKAIENLYKNMSEEAESQLYALQDEIKLAVQDGIKSHNSEFYKWLVNEYETKTT